MGAAFTCSTAHAATEVVVTLDAPALAPAGAASRALLDQSPKVIGADQLWGQPSFSTAGNGLKIGIIDDGVDQTHQFFNPTGYAMPAGFPKGDAAFTTAKVIAARAFAPASTTWKYARTPFDPVE